MTADAKAPNKQQLKALGLPYVPCNFTDQCNSLALRAENVHDLKFLAAIAAVIVDGGSIVVNNKNGGTFTREMKGMA